MTPATLSQRTVILLTPLALVGLQLTHPSNVVDTTPGWWTTLHLLQMPLFGLMALAVVWLVREQDGWATWPVGAAMGVFVVYYTALDAVAGVALGTLLGFEQGLPADQQLVVERAIDSLYDRTGVPLFYYVGKTAWILGLVACAYTLWRAGRPWPPVVLLALAGLPLYQDHARPYGPIAFGLFFVAALWLELWPMRGPVLPWPGPKRSVTDHRSP